MRVSPAEFEGELQALETRLQVLGDGLAVEGMLSASATVLEARQAIRVLWTRLNPIPGAAPPDLKVVPPPEGAGEIAG
jgi:hypothetical protein